ncbi:MAG: hypothetical protein Q9194_000639 [Teloschistes cf. exilis]
MGRGEFRGSSPNRGSPNRGGRGGGRGRGGHSRGGRERGNHHDGHMIIDQDPNQRIHKRHNHQPDDATFRGGRGRGERGCGRGFNNDRGGRGIQIRGRGRGDSRHGANNNEHNRHNSNDLVKIVVNGLLESTAASERDFGLSACRKMLVERANDGYNQPREYVYLKSPRWEGNEMVFEVKKSEVGRILKSEGQLFHGYPLSVRRAHQPDKDELTPNITEMESAEDLQKLTGVLADREDTRTKILRLESLDEDTRLATLGTPISNTITSIQATPFQRLMRLCESEQIFRSRADKAERIESISLSNNGLLDVSHIVELAKTFPDIRNLDLSQNEFRELKALELFRGKFQRLDWLILSPNPIESWNPNYTQTVVEWFPSLRKLNQIQVRTDEAAAAAVAAAAAKDDALPMATVKDNFQDQDHIAENAIRQLINGMDKDRVTLARTLYDDESTFSLSYNPSPPLLLTAQPAGWEPHLNQNRNLKDVPQLGPRIKRMAKGIKAIEQALKLLPPTRHPDLVTESNKYSFDCTPVPGIPDPKAQSASGVLGFKIDVRGSFEELPDGTTVSKTVTRSFDHTFILGPGAKPGTVRIVSDMLVLRAEGGHDALQTKSRTSADSQTGTAASTGVALPGPGDANSAEDAKRASMADQISKATGLTMQLTMQLLVDSGWNFKLALDNYKTASAKGMLKDEYFIPGFHAPVTMAPTTFFT